MALATGNKLGPNEIQSPLGAGGMGEVYRARDTRLDRTVAIATVVATPGPPALYGWPRFSPDGKSIAVTGEDPKSRTQDIWVIRLPEDLPRVSLLGR
jgi:WD40-like Beta Propeller Repeat